MFFNLKDFSKKFREYIRMENQAIKIEILREKCLKIS